MTILILLLIFLGLTVYKHYDSMELHSIYLKWSTKMLVDRKLTVKGKSFSELIVVKADGLCGGKGVIIAQSKEEAKKTVDDMLNGSSFGEAGEKVIIEEFLDGYELSVFAICDGENYKILPAAQDHKRVGDGDTGPNTGGMGAYAPTPLVNDDIYKKLEDRVIKPTLKGMQEENAPFEGVLFIGVMVVKGEPIVLEYNVRFGDPECEILMPLIESKVSELFYYGATKQLDKLDIKIKNTLFLNRLVLWSVSIQSV